MPKLQHEAERIPLLDVFNQPTGVQDATYPDEPDYSDLENNRIRDEAADAAMKLMPDHKPGPPDDGDPGDEDDSAE